MWKNCFNVWVTLLDVNSDEDFRLSVLIKMLNVVSNLTCLFRNSVILGITLTICIWLQIYIIFSILQGLLKNIFLKSKINVF